MRPHSLDICVYPVGCVALVGRSASPLLGTAFGHGEESETQSLGRSRAVRSRSGLHLLPSSNPRSLQRPKCTFCFEVPYCFSNHSADLLILAQPIPSECLFLVIKQFITKTNGQNLSFKKQSSYQKDRFSKLQMAVKFCILCGLQKCSSINYPNLDQKNMVSHLNNWILIKQMSVILFQT